MPCSPFFIPGKEPCMPELLCPHCLQPLSGGYAGTCPHCGRPLQNQNPEGALPLGTQLAGRYTVGSYLSADGGCIHLLAVPGQLTVPFGQGDATLADCYAAAGPARCLQGLRAVADLPEDAHYLAAPPDVLAALADSFGSLRVGFSGALTPAQLERFGQTGVSAWTGAEAHAFLQQLGRALPPDAACGARAAVWDAFFRQNLAALPEALPEALRAASGSLLTDLTAADLLVLEDTLALLADGSARVVSAALPCRYDPADGHCHWDEGSDASLQAFFNAAASADASGAQASSGSAPYPSTSVPPGQPSRPAR